jgi:hypothetical protein
VKPNAEHTAGDGIPDGLEVKLGTNPTVADPTTTVVAGWSAESPAVVIGSMLDARNMLRTYHSLIRSPGLPKLRFHDFRHSSATLLLVQGVHPKVVQEIFGWSDIRTVLNTYSHVIPSLRSEAASQMDAILNPVACNLASRDEKYAPN